MTLGDAIAKALFELMPRGDLTSRHLKLPDADGAAKLIAGEDLVFAGRNAVELAVRAFAPEAEFGWQFSEGDLVLGGQTVGWIKAPTGALLTAEPLARQLVSRASGIATLTRCFVHEMRDTRARVMCSRQATPGWRELEYDAVLRGGAVTPTGDASTTMRITAAHARAAGSLARAIEHARVDYQGPVEVECITSAEVELAVDAKVARICITGAVDAASARARVPAIIALEAGGVLSIERARELALAQVDFVRVDQLLTSAPAAEYALALPPRNT